MQAQFDHLKKLLRTAGELGLSHDHPINVAFVPTKADHLRGTRDKLPATFENLPTLLRLARDYMAECASVGFSNHLIHRSDSGIACGRIPDLVAELEAGRAGWEASLAAQAAEDARIAAAIKREQDAPLQAQDKLFELARAQEHKAEQERRADKPAKAAR